MRFASGALLFVALSGCTSEQGPPPCDPRVERGGRISSRGVPLRVCVGGTLELAFDIYECASNADYTSSATWSSDNARAVVERGVVRGVSAGSATIRAAIEDRSDSIEVAIEECLGDASTD